MSRRKARKKDKKAKRKKKRRRAGKSPRPLTILSICPHESMAGAEHHISAALTEAGHGLAKHSCAYPLGFRSYDDVAQAALDGVVFLGDGLALSREKGPFSLVVAYGWRAATTAHSLKMALGCPYVLVVDGSGPKAVPEAARRYIVELVEWACHEAGLVLAPSALARNEAAAAYGLPCSQILALDDDTDVARTISQAATRKRQARSPTPRPREPEQSLPKKGAARIVVDMPWDASAHMGTGAYSEAVVRGLAKAAPDVEIILAVDNEPARPIELPNVRYMTVTSPQGAPEDWRRMALPDILRRIDADVLFCPATLCAINEKVCRTVITVHDLTFRKHPEYYAPALVEHIECRFDRSLALADRIVAISEETAEDLVRLCNVPPGKITVVHPPLRDIFLGRASNAEVTRILEAIPVERPFFFHVSNLAPHKNVVFAVEVLSLFLQDNPDTEHGLVIAGGAGAPNKPPDFMAVAEQLGIADRVTYVGRVSDEQLRALYQGCETFLFPSLAEGWGLPVVEAVACGARTLATGVPAALAVAAETVGLDCGEWARQLAHSPTAESRVPARDAAKELYDVLLPSMDGSASRLSSEPRNARRVSAPPPAPRVARPSLKAFLVLGPESTGTRCCTQLLIQAGCQGDAGHWQRFDTSPPRDVTPVVWRRSVPHQKGWPSISRMAALLANQGYEVRAVVTTRDWYATVRSQVQGGHVADEGEAIANLRKAYPFIFSQLQRSFIPFWVLSYEAYVRRPREVAARLMEMMGLPEPAEIHAFDGNAKHYGRE